jgi:hypothetical protein
MAGKNGKKEFGTDALTGRSADRSNAGDLPGPCAYYRAMLINDLADIDNEVFVFLDDYHLVTDPAIRRAVSFLLRHAPLDPRSGKSDLIALGPGAAPHGVIVGPDGAAWVTEGHSGHRGDPSY